MTDVYCSNTKCLNNRKGWCTAKGIKINRICQSYATSSKLMSGQHALVEKRNGKYKSRNGNVLK